VHLTPATLLVSHNLFLFADTLDILFALVGFANRLSIFN